MSNSNSVASFVAFPSCFSFTTPNKNFQMIASRQVQITKPRSVSPSTWSSSSTASTRTEASETFGSPDAAQLLSDSCFSEDQMDEPYIWPLMRKLRNIGCGAVVASVMVVFSFWLPFTLAREAALKTYLPAFWNYDSDVSLFDNTFWTYGTDYLLGICMLLLTVSVPKTSLYKVAGWKTAGLLACYLFSVTAGGMAHQFYTTNESRNSTSFRLLWTVCVGTVASASGFMGAIAGELVRLRGLVSLPSIPDSFWAGYAFSIAVMVVGGWFSYQRPACDLFIVGITQFPSTMYMMAALMRLEEVRNFSSKSLLWRLLGSTGFLLNAPLLPLYPVLVQYTDWSLGAVNTLLHSWLMVAWSLQGLSLRQIGNCINNDKLKQ